MSLRVLAVDPGSQNHGVAVVEFDGDEKEKILLREIIEAGYLEAWLEEAASQYLPAVTVIGSGSQSKKVAQAADRAGLTDIRIISEKNTTQEARYRYLDENLTPWYFKLIPKSLRLPKHHCDDWAAVILAERIGRG